MATSGVSAPATRVLRAVLDEPRRQLVPAAIRVERSTAKGEKGRARQTALTVWFTEGPSLPGPISSGPSARTVAGTVAGIVGVVALGALGLIAVQRQPGLLSGEEPPRLLQPSSSDSPATAQD